MPETRALAASTCHNLVVVSCVQSSPRTVMGAALPVAGLVAVNAGASDPGSTRLVYGMVVGLAVVGVAFVALAIWLIRQTRADPELLAPLERMGDGDWRRKDPATQRRLLDESRPEGATPVHTEPAPPSLDDEFEHAEDSMRSLDDLDRLPPERGGAAPTPANGLTEPDIAVVSEVDADEDSEPTPPDGIVEPDPDEVSGIGQSSDDGVDAVEDVSEPDAAIDGDGEAMGDAGVGAVDGDGR